MTQEVRTDRLVVGGNPKDPNEIQLGGSAIPGQPHHKIDFQGPGVAASDQGGGVAGINIPEAVAGAGAPAAGPQIEIPSGAWIGPQQADFTKRRSDNNPGLQIVFNPFVVPVAMIFDRIRVWAQLAAGSLSGETFAMGVYANDATEQKPSNKLLEVFVTMPSSGTDVSALEQVINLALPPGVYWFAFQRGVMGGMTLLDFLGSEQLGGFNPGRVDTWNLARAATPWIGQQTALAILGTATIGSWPATAVLDSLTFDPPVMVNMRRQ
jgi:hypothetical protein